MSFNDALEQSIVRKGPKCSVKVWRDGLEKADQEQFDAALLSQVSTSVIHRAMKVLGYQNGDHSLGRHRRQECGCVIQ